MSLYIKYWLLANLLWTEFIFIVYIYIYISECEQPSPDVFIYQTLYPSWMWHKVIFFSAEFDTLEFRVFFLLDQLPYQG